MKTFNDYIKSIKDGTDLSVNESEDAFDKILLQKAKDNEIIDFLTSLSKKGESVDEIFGAVKSIKKKAKIIKGFEDSFDTCGTGGDSKGTFNISTISAIIVSCCGVRVAKHGNKAVSSKSGSADVLSKLGVDINVDEKTIIKCLKELNLCFLFAPNYHPILKNVAEIRKKIGKRTIFNILGPLLNPVECKRQIIGVYDKKLLTKVAEVLKKMGTEKAWVVHGGGLDELTVTGINYVAEVNKKKIKTFQIDPRKLTIDRYDIRVGQEHRMANEVWNKMLGLDKQRKKKSLKELQNEYRKRIIEEEKKIPITGGYRNKLFDCDGEFLALDESYMQVGDVKKSALLIKEILKMGFSHPVAVHLGFKVRSGEHLDITYLNCGAALVVAGKAKNIEEGMDIAYKEILSGRPLLKLYNLIKITNKKYYDRYIKKYIKR